MLDAVDEIPDTRKAKPKCLDAGFAFTFSSEEATEHGDSANNLAQRGYRFRSIFLRYSIALIFGFV
jgi:hypothetical protein